MIKYGEVDAISDVETYSTPFAYFPVYSDERLKARDCNKGEVRDFPGFLDCY